MNILQKIGLLLMCIGVLGGFVIIDVLAFKANIMFGLILIFAFIFVIGAIIFTAYKDY